MKNIALLISAFFTVLGCSTDNVRYKNPYLPNYNFSIDINENLPTYSELKIPMNPVYVNNGTTGVSGIIVMRISDTDYRAWEAACPNQPPTSCSTMNVEGLYAQCNCETSHRYSLFDGTAELEYGMRPYRVEVLSNTAIRVYN